MISPKPQNFAYATSHIKTFKYDSTSGTKISMFEKSWGWSCGLEQAPLDMFSWIFLVKRLQLTCTCVVDVFVHMKREKTSYLQWDLKFQNEEFYTNENLICE